MNILSDPISEKYVLSCLYNGGDEAYYEVSDIICEECFLIDYNQLFFRCIKHAVVSKELKKLDIGTIQSSANSLKIDHIISKKAVIEHIKNIIDTPTEINNVRPIALKLKKLQVGRIMVKEIEKAQEKALNISGDEDISHILAITEQIGYNISEKINDQSNKPTNVSEHIEEYYHDIRSREIQSIGISTGYPKYDHCIGGGLRPGSVSLIGARTKNGKSLLGTNIGLKVAGNLKIPVLVLDTELTLEEHMNRFVALGSKTPPKLLETGQFKNTKYNTQVISFVERIKSKQVPYYHRTIAGKPFEEHLAIMRRWIMKHVGLDGNNHAKPCIVIYDYLKLMFGNDIAKMAEYQALGFMMTELHNFSVKYNLPILSFVQLNRDGITGEGTDVIAQSDRIGWLCSNFSVFKMKSPEELAEDGEENGNFKLVPIVARHGPGIEQGNYINFSFDRSCLKIEEKKTKFEILDEQRNGPS